MSDDEILCCHKSQMLFLFEHATCIKKEVECQGWSGIWLEKSEPVFEIPSLGLNWLFLDPRMVKSSILPGPEQEVVTLLLQIFPLSQISAFHTSGTLLCIKSQGQ